MKRTADYGSPMQREWCAYVRVSKVGGREGDSFHSPEQQEQEIRRATPGKVVTTFVDLDVSGTTFNRGGLEDALAWLREAPTRRGLAAYDFSRIGRNAREFLALVDDVAEMGAELLTVNERFDTTTPEGRLMLTQFAGLNEFYSRNIGRRWKSVQQRRVEQGLPSGGGARFGYRLERGQQVPDPVTGPALRQAYLSYTAGAGYQAMVKRLNDAGLKTSRGTEWSTHTLRRCLDSGFGAGLLVTRSGGREEYLPGAHEPVISADEWEAFRRARERRRQLPSKVRTPRWYLAGLVRCGYCGATLSVGSFRDPQGSAICSAYKNSRTCRGVWVPRWAVEHSVTNWVGAHVSELAAHSWDTSARDEVREDVERRLAAAQGCQERAQAALQRLAHAYATGLLDEASVTAARRDLDAERQAAEDEVAALHAELDALLPVDADDYLRLAEATEDMTPSEWGQLLGRVLREVRVTAEELTFVPVVGEPRTVARPQARQGARATQPRTASGRFAKK